MTPEQRNLYTEWKRLINLPSAILREFLNSDYGKSAGLSRADASAQGIRSGRDSGRAILRMREKGVSAWNQNDWQWAASQVAFVRRMSGTPGALMREGEPTRKYLALLVWGHEPSLLRNGSFSSEYRAWFLDGEWVQLRAGITHADFARDYLNDWELVDSVAIAKLTKLGGIKQWGNSFVMRELTDRLLSVIQDRVQEMVNAHPSGYAGTVVLYWGKTDMLEVPIPELLEVRHASELTMRYRHNGGHYGVRGWIIDNVWYPLKLKEKHEDYAYSYLKQMDHHPATRDDAASMLLAMGAIKIWGTQVVIGTLSDDGLGMVQEVMMDHEYSPDEVVLLVFSPYSTDDFVSAKVEEILSARSWRAIQSGH